LSQCPRPLDPEDVEALAAGIEPSVAPDALIHVASCDACARAVQDASEVTKLLESVPELSWKVDLSERVLRRRPFSRTERRSIGLWSGPWLFAGGIFAAGVAILTAPALTAREQAGLGMAAVAPLLALARAVGRSLADILWSAPSGLGAVAQALSGQRSLGLAALLLLVPAGFGLRRALVRVRR
jgi:hypothetical protein